MPFVNRIDHSRRVVFAKASGSIDCAEMQAFLENVSLSGLIDYGFAGLVDTRPMTDYRLTPAETRWLASAYPMKTRSRWSFVAPNSLAFAMLRMYVAYAARSFEMVRVHRTIRDGLDWIGTNRLRSYVPDPAKEPEPPALAARPVANLGTSAFPPVPPFPEPDPADDRRRAGWAVS